MIHTVALSMDFTRVAGTTYKKPKYVHANGLSFETGQLIRGLKQRLTILATHPGGKSLMVILVIAFP
jgi:hypothetical protein